MTQANSAVLDRHAQQVKEANARVLGYVVWHAMADLRITPAQLQAVAARHGIGKTPDLGDPSDAFRRATSPCQKRGESRKIRYLMRPVGQDDKTIVRHIVAERVDSAGKKLGHAAVAELVFDRATKTMRTGRINVGELHTPTEAKEVGDLMRKAEELFSEYRGSLTGDEMTRFVMRQLKAMSYVTVHPHGHVYFVPGNAGPNVERLRGFVRDLRPYAKDDSTFNVVPVPDVTEQRQMVMEGFVSSVQKDLAEVSGAVAELLGSGSKPNEATVNNRVGEIALIREKAKRYTDLLGTQVAEVEEALKILETQTGDLLDRASKPDEDAVIARVKLWPGVEVNAKDRTAHLTRRGYRAVVRFNRRGWTVISQTTIDPDLSARAEVSARAKAGGWSATTAEADVAELFLKAALAA